MGNSNSHIKRDPYLKVPIEMAQFALRGQVTNQIGCYLTCQFLYPGKVNMQDRPVSQVARSMELSIRTIKRYLKWLENRNWVGRDIVNGWIFFRSLNRVHEIENWKFRRAAILYQKDLTTIKEFCLAAVLASLIKTGREARTERYTRRSEPTASPISLTLISNILGVSRSTAQRYRKSAELEGYIENDQCFVKVLNLKPEDMSLIKRAGINAIPVELLGYSDRKIVPIDRIRYKDNTLYLQEPNLIRSLISLKSRRGNIR